VNGHFIKEGLQRNVAAVQSNFQLGLAMQNDGNYSKPKDPFYSNLSEGEIQEALEYL
jgi:hypothetical protein